MDDPQLESPTRVPNCKHISFSRAKEIMLYKGFKDVPKKTYLKSKNNSTLHDIVSSRCCNAFFSWDFDKSCLNLL